MTYKEYTLGELLSYEQPTKYIVNSTKYDDSYHTPVLTAGKSFIIGYTNETDGIYDKLPVIIFDDFTTSSQYVNFKFKVKSSAMKILTPNTDLVLPKYIYYQMQIINIDHSTHKRYWIQQYSKLKVSVPSLPEQERIVAHIEELFSELDAGVETLKKTKAQLDVYRQAVLKEAFENISTCMPLKNIAKLIDPEPSHRTPPQCEGGIPYVGIGDIDYKNKTINFASSHKIAKDKFEEHQNRYTLCDGDFIMGKIGTIGKPFRVVLPQNYTLSANVILIQPNKKLISPSFLFWQFSSPFITKQLALGSKATTQAAFGIKKARLLSIKTCSNEKQKEIIDFIESKMTVCNNIEQTIDAALEQAKALRHSILKEAFEGKM